MKYSVKGLLKTFSPLLFVALAICGYYIYENYTGAKRWKELKSALEADGIITDRSIFQTTLPPADENFAAHSLISSCYESADANGNVIYDRPDEYDRFAAMKLERLPGRYPDGNWATGAPFQFDRFIEAIEKAGQLTVPKQGSDAARFLGAFAPYKGELAALEKAAKRPYAKMPFAAPEGNPYLMLTPYFDDFRAHGRFQKYRAIALLKEDRPDEALASLRVLLQIARTAGSHPSIIGTLIEIALHRFCFEVIMMGIEDQKWSDLHLIEIQEIISNQTIFDHAQRGFNAELVSGIIFTDTLKKNRDFSSLKTFISDPFWRIAPILPYGIWDHNKAYGSEGLVVEIQSLRNGKLINTHSPVVRRPENPRTILADATWPAFSGITKSIFEAETLKELTILSCAIERYRLKTQAYPDDVNMLTPQFISKIPMDRFDKSTAAIKYILDRENNTYIVYSVGINGTDELGKTAVRSSGRRDKENGDLSWGIPCPWPALKK